MERWAAPFKMPRKGICCDADNVHLKWAATRRSISGVLTSAAFRRLLDERAVTNERCWVSPSRSRTGFGYTRIWHDGKVTGAHRVAWEAANGPIPSGLFVLHRCDNPPCFNPDHLFLGTDADNKADMYAKGRGSCTDPTFRQKVRAAWTPEKRAAHAERTRERVLTERIERARSAGYPDDWAECTVCFAWKASDAFTLAPRKVGGRISRCRDCTNEYNRRYRARRP